MLKGRFAWDDWIMGIVAAFIGGGSGAISGGVGTSLLDPGQFNLQHPSKLFALMAWTFVINGFLSMMAFLHQNSVPPVVTVTTTQTVQETKNPAALTIKTVKETKTEEPTPPQSGL